MLVRNFWGEKKTANKETWSYNKISMDSCDLFNNHMTMTRLFITA